MRRKDRTTVGALQTAAAKLADASARQKQPDAPKPNDDAALLAQALRGVQPLPGNARDRVLVAPDRRAVPRRPTAEQAALAELDALVSGEGPFRLDDTGETVSGLAPGVDPRLLRQLKRGHYSVQAHIDLHGLRKDEAKREVERFLSHALASGFRCVLIVHGRGLRSKDQVPVLKESVVKWLSSGALSRPVLAFATARPSDGGLGALYVLLRRPTAPA